MFLKKDYTFEELLKEERVVYFDIDGTLGGSINMHKYKMKKEYQSKKRAEMNEMFKRIGVYTFSLGDYTSGFSSKSATSLLSQPPSTPPP